MPLDEVQPALIARSEKIYPRQAHGLFTRLKFLSMLVLLGVFYGLPWLHWDGHQAFLIDLPSRKFYVFGFTFWPQDVIYVTFLLIIATLSLFFFTTLAGRLWCGFACPQTIWTDAFVWMERLVEGDRSRQMKLDKMPWSMHKFRIKAAKHSLWILFSLGTGFSFLGYFIPIRELAPEIINFTLSPMGTFWLLFYAFATYGNAGYLREQICIYMCPYARFQSAMFDRDTLLIAYDEKRGEPRGPRKRDEDYKARNLGECVHCTLCVRVCPTGIDIRDGLQYQCIGCSACIDVCDEVMDKMSYPKGLIGYTTQNTLEGNPTRIFRPRIWIYGFLLLVLIVSTGYAVSLRIPLEMDVIRDRNTLYRETQIGLIENVYLLKIINMDKKAHAYELEASGINGLQLKMDHERIFVNAGAVLDMPVRLQADPVDLDKRSTHIRFQLTAKDDRKLMVNEAARFLGTN
ncbi:MAG: cytochrome c oxidase accessory protein CcoG [Gammaproteobacteria bacterium]|nr:cytochrome c oxidase accessory protein CcoG [Gammaproteobacteria bacterium]